MVLRLQLREAAGGLGHAVGLHQPSPNSACAAASSAPRSARPRRGSCAARETPTRGRGVAQPLDHRGHEEHVGHRVLAQVHEQRLRRRRTPRGSASAPACRPVSSQPMPPVWNSGVATRLDAARLAGPSCPRRGDARREVAVGQQHALGQPAGPGRVQLQHDVGRCPPPARVRRGWLREPGARTRRRPTTVSATPVERGQQVGRGRAPTTTAAACRVAGDRVQLLGGQPPVERHGDRAGADAAQQGLDQLDARCAGAASTRSPGSSPGRHEAGAEAAGPVVELAVGDLPVAGDQRDPVALLRCRVARQPRDREGHQAASSVGSDTIARSIALPPVRAVVAQQPRPRVALDQRREDDLALQPRERRAQAEVRRRRRG